MNDVLSQLGSVREKVKRVVREVIYARVSTREQEKQETIQIQVERLTKEIEKTGGELVDKYIDNGYSGELMERPELDRLLSEIEEKEVDVVRITDPDRLARGFIPQAILKQQIEDKGASVVFLSLPPANSPEQELGHQVQAAVSEFERKKIKQRTRLGKLQKAKKGLIVGGRSPYGYRYISRTRERPGGYEVVEEEARWVKKIFEWTVFEGLSTEKIARKLTELKTPTQSGNPVWRKSTVHHILHNETYAGTAYYNKYRAVQPKAPHKTKGYPRFKNTSRLMRPKEEWIPIPAPSIIDRQIWELAQRRFQENARLSPRNTRHPYLFRGKVFCGLCDLPYYGGVSKSTLFYQCSNRYHMSPLPKTCEAGSVNAAELDCVGWESISDALTHPEILINQLKELGQADATTLDNRMRQLETVQKRLRQLERAKSKVTNLYLYHQEVLSEKEYLERMQEIEVGKEKLQKEKENLEVDLDRSFNYKDVKNEIEFVYTQTVANLDSLSFEDKRRIVELLVDKIIVTGDKVRIEGIIPPIKNLPTDSPGAVRIASNSSPCEVQNDMN